MTFEVDATTLVAVAHLPVDRATDIGVVIIVGGPQYRVGSHRQFVLLARSLADAGVAVLRFDLMGMGDSEGDPPGFDHASVFIRGAIDALLRVCPGVQRVCLWGLCDGASASLIYAPSDVRVACVVLANPWVRTEQGLAQSYLDNYYTRRIRNRRWWLGMLRKPATLPAAARDFLANWRRSRTRSTAPGPGLPDHFLERMICGAEAFDGRMLVLLSGRDLVAAEFTGACSKWPRWRAVFAAPRVTVERLDRADHTFSRREWRDWVAARTVEFTVSC